MDCGQRVVESSAADVAEPREQLFDLRHHPARDAPVPGGRGGREPSTWDTRPGAPRRLADVLHEDNVGRGRSPAHPDTDLGHDERAHDPTRQRDQAN